MQYSRYELIDVLGQGGMATVYLARDPVLDRPVALKVIRFGVDRDGTLEKRFSSEARACAALHHTHIIAIHDFGSQEGEQFLVMEYISGPNLDKLVRAHPGGLSDTVTAALLLQASEGLAEAHRKGIVHRDIKPENMLLTTDGDLKIADFGIARSQAEPGLTQTGAMLGSPKFMSPEQVECGEIGPASDMFSLGGVLFFCLTGTPPFPGNSIPAILYHVSQAKCPDLQALRPDLDPFWDVLLHRLMEKDPAKRTLSAATLAEELRGYLGRKLQPNPRDMVRNALSSTGLNNQPEIPREPTVGLLESLKTRSPTGPGTGSTARTGSSGAHRAKRKIALPLMAMSLVVLLLIGALVTAAVWLGRSASVSIADKPRITEDPVVDSGSGLPATSGSGGAEAATAPEGNDTRETAVLSDNDVTPIISRLEKAEAMGNEELLGALRDAMQQPGELLRLADAIRRYAPTHEAARSVLEQADYFAIAALQSQGRLAEARQACVQYVKDHPDGRYGAAVESIRQRLGKMQTAGID